MNQDEQHLDLLKIFYFVFAALQALGGCVPIVHLTLGVAMIAGKLNGKGGDAGPEALGWFFVAIAAVLMTTFWTMAALTFTAGRRLAERRGYTFCIVIAAVLCLFMPLGTILGVFTIIVLQRPSVKARFGVT
jgi:hypothetical protein